jgi:ketopantoate reductase
MDILVYGAGPLGSILAARLQQGGHRVSLLARGQRLESLREHSIVLHSALDDTWITTDVTIVERLAPDDAYDLTLVVMRKNSALQILPILAANRASPNVLFLMNNAAGPDALTAALGNDRVLIGFPGAAGYREGHVVHGFIGSSRRPVTVLFGEVDGRITARTRRIAEALEQGSHMHAEIRTDMDTWLKYHTALLMPSLAPALYMCGTDNQRLARTRDALVLAIRAIREAFQVLMDLEMPITPPRYRIMMWVPEPLLVLMFKRLLMHEAMEIALVRHAEAARDEIQHLTHEFLTLAQESDVPIPTIQRLYPHLAPDAPLMEKGKRSIPMQWGGLRAGAAVVAGLMLAVILLRRHQNRSERKR